MFGKLWKNNRIISTDGSSICVTLDAFAPMGIRYPDPLTPKPRIMAILKDYVYFSPSSASATGLPRGARSRGFALYDYRKDGTKVLLVDCYGMPFVLWPEPGLLDAFLRNEAGLEDLVRRSRATTLTMRGLGFMQRLRMAYWVSRLGAALRDIRTPAVG
jgi:hypothetical protein